MSSSIQTSIDRDWATSLAWAKQLILRGTQFSYHEGPEGHVISWVVSHAEGNADRPKEVG
jgi:hypothetical protein